MGDLRVYRMEGSRAIELPGRGAHVEVELQRLIEANLECLFGVRLVEAAYRFSGRFSGEIDALGLDENGCPVVLEFKRHGDHNVIGQGLAYLDWLLDHPGDFRQATEQALGRQAADEIDWSGPRLVCVAGAFTAYDEHLVDRIDRSVELVRYRIFGRRELLSLELVRKRDIPRPAPASSGFTGTRRPNPSARNVTSVIHRIDLAPASLQELYEALETLALGLGEEVTRRFTKHYVAFRRMRNFLCVQVLTGIHTLVVDLNLDPATVDLVDGFTRDVSSTGHLGTGDLEVRIRDHAGLKRAEPLIRASYELS